MLRRFSSQFLGMNSAVVYQGNTAYLVDPGVFPWEIERIERFLEKESLSHLTVLLTHTHGDHISGWHRFRKHPTYGHRAIQSKPLAMRENDLKYLKGMWRKQGIEELDQLAFPEPIHYLENGSLQPIPPYSFTLYHVPGHSVDMSVIIIPEEEMIFSGDMLIQTPLPFILHSTYQYWHSLKLLKQLVHQYNLRCLVPGHGKPAKTQEEILRRIEHERHYLRQLVWQGIKYARAGYSGDELRQQLYQLYPDNSGFHPHQTNVQTFLRELDLWLAKENFNWEME